MNCGGKICAPLKSAKYDFIDKVDNRMLVLKVLEISS